MTCPVQPSLVTELPSLVTELFSDPRALRPHFPRSYMAFLLATTVIVMADVIPLPRARPLMFPRIRQPSAQKRSCRRVSHDLLKLPLLNLCHQLQASVTAPQRMWSNWMRCSRQTTIESIFPPRRYCAAPWRGQWRTGYATMWRQPSPPSGSRCAAS